MIIEIKSSDDNNRESKELIDAKALAMRQYMEHTGMPMGLFHDNDGLFSLHGTGDSFLDFCKDHSGDKLKTFDDNGNLVKDVDNDAFNPFNSLINKSDPDLANDHATNRISSSLNWMSELGFIDQA